MIQLDCLEIENFRSYQGVHQVWLSKRGLVRVLGRNLDEQEWSPSNGSGKSGLLDAVEWVLCGTSPRDEGADGVVPDGTKLPVRGKAWLSDERGWKYMVERSRKGGAPLVTFSGLDPSGTPKAWDAAKAADVQKLINQELGIQADVWRATTYWAQGAEFDFAGASDGERKEILAKLLPELGEVAKLAKALQLLVAETQLQVQGDEKRTAELTGLVAGLKARDWTAEAGEWEAARSARASALKVQIAGLASREQELAQALSTLPLLRAAMETTQAQEELTAAEKALAEAQTALAQLGAEPAPPQAPTAGTAPGALTQAQEAARQYEQAFQAASTAEQTARSALVGEANALTAELLHIGQRLVTLTPKIAALQAGECDACHRPGYHGPSHAQQLAEALAEQHALQTRQPHASARLEAIPEALVALRKAWDDQQPGWTTGRQQHEQAVSQQAQAVGAHKAAQETFKQLQQAYQQGQQARASWRGAQDRATQGRQAAHARFTLASQYAPPDPRGSQVLQTIAGQLQAAEGEQGRVAQQRTALQVQLDGELAAVCPLSGQQEQSAIQLAELEGELGELAGRLADGKQRLEGLTFWKDACGPTELPSLILASRVQELTDAANVGVMRLTGGRVWVSLGAISQTKGGELRDKTVLYVHRQRADGTMSVQEFGSYSGGERDRIRLGTAVGLARFVGQRATRAFDLLLIDEAFSSFLDQAGRTAAAELVRDLAQERGTVLLVTHEDGFSNLTAKDLVVEKKGGISRIVSGAGA